MGSDLLRQHKRPDRMKTAPQSNRPPQNPQPLIKTDSDQPSCWPLNPNDLDTVLFNSTVIPRGRGQSG